MPAKRDRAAPAPPRLDAGLRAQPEPLADGVSWAGVDAAADASFSGTAYDYEVIGSRLCGVRLTGAVLEGGRWADVVLEDCELSGTSLEGATLVRVELTRCRLSGLVAIGVHAQDVRLADCKLNGANFRGASLERCAFEDCDLSGADFYGARFPGGALRRCVLSETEFSKARCDGIDLRGSELHGLRGASALQGCVITPEQAVPLGLALLPTIGARVED